MSLNEASSSEPPAKRVTRADDSVPAQSSQECSICRRAARFGCLYCSSAPYCSIACLEIGQVTHESLCQQLNSFTIKSPKPQPPPNHSVVLGSIFHETSTDVVFVWVLYKLQPGQNAAEPYQKPAFMTGSVVGIGSIYNFDWENNSLLKLLENRTHLPGDAPLVGVKLSRKHVKNHEPYEDITIKDLEMVAESRTWQGKFLGRSEADQAKGLLAGNSLYESVRGVRVESSEAGYKYRESSYRLYGPLMKDGNTLEFSKVLGLPMNFIYTSSSEWPRKQHLHSPAFLHKTPSSILHIARQDGKDITPLQAEALLQYSRRSDGGTIREWADFLTVNSERLMNNRQLRVDFEAFFESYKKEQIENGKVAWAEEKSPYEV